MIKVYSLYNGVTTDITNAIKTITNTGDISTVARKIDITLAYPIWDINQPRISLAPGAKIWMLLDGLEIFRGIAWIRDIKSLDQELTFTAYDYLIYLTKSKVTYNFINITPEDATTEICGELGITIGSLAITGIKVSRLIAQQTGYDAIIQMYTQASIKNGKKYIPVMDGLKLNIIEKGKTVVNYVLNTQINGVGNNIGDVDYQDTLDNMINKVKIYNGTNGYVSSVSNNNDIANDGLIQDNYTEETGTDATSAAKGMLHGVDQVPTINNILGNWDCRTGYAVNTSVFYISNLLNVEMYIDGDVHTWEVATGKYTMDLNLSFKNLMDSEE